jgi:hypothetical protein
MVNDAGKTSLGSAEEDGYAVLGGLLRHGCVELMTEYGLSAILQAPSATGGSEAGAAFATVDFQGHDMRGTIGLTMTASVLVQTYRAAVGAEIRPGSAEACDWACELVNQLMGRVKNKLRTYSVSFTVNTPRVHLVEPIGDAHGAIRNRFVCDQGGFAGFLEVMLAPGFSLQRSSSETPLIDEGDLVFF